MEIQSYLNEQELVVLLTKQDLNDNEKKHLIKLLQMNLSWDKVIGILELHRVAGIAWLNIKKYFFNNNQNRCSCPRLYKYLMNSYNIQTCRAKEQLKYTLEVCELLNKNGIKYVLLKGIAVSKELYNDLGLRDFNDNDILVHPNEVEKAKNLILSLDYRQGDSKHLTKITKPTRKEIMIRKINSHEIVPLIKDVSNDTYFLTQHIIDLHFSVNLMTKNREENDLEEWFESRNVIRFNNCSINVLNWEYLLIFLSEHFYKEAVSHRDLMMYKDLLLYKLCDIYFLIKNKSINWDKVISLSIKYNFTKQLCFTLKYLSAIYDIHPINEIITTLESRNTFSMDNVYYYDSKEIAYTYTDQSLKERIFDINKPCKAR